MRQSTVQLSKPSGAVSGGVLTFVGTLLDPAAAGTGNITTATITDSNGVVMVSGLTVGTAAGFDIIISNGLNSTLISSGQAVQVLAAQIIGS